ATTDGTIYVLCGGGSKAAKAVALLNEIDPKRDIVHLTGGTRAAKAAGMTIVSDNL
ncbi:MAG TPA: sulfurtransferase, partial [Moraxellaceae bacterium]|nr:sulfurtransferase [Moraxellaceae bacterium]